MAPLPCLEETQESKERSGLADEAGLLSFGAIKSSAETALLKNWMKCRYKNSILSLYGSSVSW